MPKNLKFCYKYKDGRFLKRSYMGDGDYELVLTKKITTNCIFSQDWELRQILTYCDGVYDDNGQYIADTLEESDFVRHEVEIKLK